jgi:hypothetical protein
MKAYLIMFLISIILGSCIIIHYFNWLRLKKACLDYGGFNIPAFGYRARIIGSTFPVMNIICLFLAFVFWGLGI